MARETIITDDLDGTHDAEPVQFGWDGVTWEIDLAEGNRKKLEEALKPYLDKAHPANIAQAKTAGGPRARSTTAWRSMRVILIGAASPKRKLPMSAGTSMRSTSGFRARACGCSTPPTRRLRIATASDPVQRTRPNPQPANLIGGRLSVARALLKMVMA